MPAMEPRLRTAEVTQFPEALGTVCLFYEATGNSQRSIDYTPILEAWIGQPLPVLRVDSARSPTPCLRMFIASHDLDVHVHIHSTRICLTCDADVDRRYEIRGLSGGLGAQRWTEDRITALSFSIDTLLSFFGGRHLLPHLASFDLIVDFKPDRGWPTAGSQAKNYYLQAPQLRHFAVVVSHYMAFSHDRQVAHVAKNFLDRLRSWIRYDAPGLDSIAVRGPSDCVETHITPLDLGRLAREYIVDTSDSGRLYDFPRWPEPPRRLVC